MKPGRKPTPIQTRVLEILRDGGEVSCDSVLTFKMPAGGSWKYRRNPNANWSTMEGLEERGLVRRLLRPRRPDAPRAGHEWFWTLTEAGQVTP